MCVHDTSYQSTGIPIERFTSSLPRRRRIHPPERVRRDERLLLLYFFTLVSYIMSKRNPFFSGKYIFVWPKTVRLCRRRYRSLRRPANTNTRRKKRSLHTCCSRMSPHPVPVVPRVGAVRKCAAAGATINNATADFSGARESTATTTTRVRLVTLRSHHSRRLHQTTQMLET